MRKSNESLANVSDLMDDLLTVLQSKLEACAAYDLYMKDCQKAGDKEAEKLLTSLKQTMSGISRSWSPRSSDARVRVSCAKRVALVHMRHNTSES